MSSRGTESAQANGCVVHEADPAELSSLSISLAELRTVPARSLPISFVVDYAQRHATPEALLPLLALCDLVGNASFGTGLEFVMEMLDEYMSLDRDWTAPPMEPAASSSVEPPVLWVDFVTLLQTTAVPTQGDIDADDAVEAVRSDSIARKALPLPLVLLRRADVSLATAAATVSALLAASAQACAGMGHGCSAGNRLFSLAQPLFTTRDPTVADLLPLILQVWFCLDRIDIGSV